MNCGNCGNPLAPGATFCAVCGARNIQPAYAQNPPQKKSGSGKWILLSGTVSLVLVIGLIWFIVSYGNNNNAPVYVPDNPNASSDDRRNDPQDTPVQPTPAPQDDAPLTPSQIFNDNKNAIFRIAIFQGDTHVSWGSGFFISSTGIAVTNHHVMDGATGGIVILEDDSEYPITGYYSSDFGNDLAVIQVGDGSNNFDFLTIGDSSSVSIGDNVYAVGGPDGDPLTFTNGIISRFATEPLQYDNYTVSGMFQSTATIYGGNSGGPLLNDRGHVIGINSAGYTGRDSQQWAVPINRVTVPNAGEAVSSLPIGNSAQTQWDGNIMYLSRFPFIPDFQSVSRNAVLRLAGTANDMGFDLLLDIDEFGVYHFDYALSYALGISHFVSDTDEYDIVLSNNGFMMQDIISVDLDNVGRAVYVFLYNQAHNTSLAYEYFAEYEILYVFIGSGNAYEQLGGGGRNNGGGNTEFAGYYPGYPGVPDAGLLFPAAELLGFNYASEYGVSEIRLNGELFVGASDIIYVYALPIQSINDVDTYTNVLLSNGFIMTQEQVDNSDGYSVYGALFYHQADRVFVSSLYSYDDETWWVVLD